MSPTQLLITRNGEPRRAGLAVMCLILGAAIWLESCALLTHLPGNKGDDVLKFSHAAHAKHTNDCNACHLNKDDQTVVAASHATCVECHAAAADKPADDSCKVCHHTLTPKPSKDPERPNYERANFSHESHKETTCATCHGNVNHARSESAINFPRMEECLACHFPAIGEPSTAECYVCHFDITPTDMPANHKQADWKIAAHGPMALNEPDLCVRCHVKANDCQTCHAMERPPSHTSVFRAKTHGLLAMSNPNKCEICHTQDFCEVCHRTTEPLSHTASFKGRPYLHCTTCHLPLEEGNRCAVCHQGDPHAHVVAKSPPPELIAAGLIKPDESCLPCHPVQLVPITHPYNTISTTECITCHRF